MEQSQTTFTLETIMQVARLAVLIPLEEVVALRNEIDRIETVTPITGPTWYRNNMKRTQDHKEFVDAFITFRKAIAKHE